VIALDLDINERTVEGHRAQVMKKLDVATLAQLVKVKFFSNNLYEFRLDLTGLLIGLDFPWQRIFYTKRSFWLIQLMKAGCPPLSFLMGCRQWHVWSN
jgi:hypothetical protein